MQLRSIQCLRAVAALLVVYAHGIDLQMSYAISYQQNFYYLQNFGAIGVDIFFVISGFIITYVANKYSGSDGGAEFFKKRFIRINPIYYLASLLYITIILLPVIFTKGVIIKWGMLVHPLISTFIILPTAGSLSAYDPLLHIGWTLSFEWLFYLLFILLILLKSKDKPFHLLLLITALVTIGQIVHVTDYRYVFATNAIMLEFLLGVILFMVYSGANVPATTAYTLLYLGLIGYVSLIFLGFGLVSEMGYTLNGQLSLQRFIIWGIPSGLIVAGSLLLEKQGRLSRIWSNKFFLLVGDASYSIYLVHLSVYLLLRLFYQKNGFIFQPDLAILIHVMLATAGGILFYLYVEKPLMRRLQHKKSAGALPLHATIS